jgi:glucose dehydrogenase
LVSVPWNHPVVNSERSRACATRQFVQTKPGEQQLGSTVTETGGNNPGVLAAIDARSGRLVWERHWPTSCYSGTVTTAGKLVFVGRNGGQLQAYVRPRWDARTYLARQDTGRRKGARGAKPRPPRP